MKELKNLQNNPNPTHRKRPVLPSIQPERPLLINYNKDSDCQTFLVRQDRLPHECHLWERHTTVENAHKMHNMHNTNWQFSHLCQNQMTGHRHYAYNSRCSCHRQQPNIDMSSHLLEVQNKVIDTLHRVQQHMDLHSRKYRQFQLLTTFSRESS